MSVEDESLPAARGSRWLIPALVVVGLLAFAAWAIATPLAFQRVWLPLASRAADGTIEADDGHWVWPVGLVAEGLRLDLATGAGTVDRVEFDLAALASLRAGYPVVSRLLLAGAELRVEQARDDAGSEPDVNPVEGADEPVSVPAFEIRHARVSEVRVSVVAESGTTEIGPIRLDIDDWFGASRGRASFEVPATRRLEAGGEQTLRARGSVTLGDAVHAPASEDVEPVATNAEEQGAETAAESAEDVVAEPAAEEAEPGSLAAEASPTGGATDDRARLVVEMDLDVDDGEASGVEPLALALRARGWVSEDGEAVDLDDASLALAEGGIHRGRLGAKGALLPALDVQLDVDAEHVEPDLASPDDDLRLRGGVALAGTLSAPRIEPDLRLGPIPSSSLAEDDELLVHLTGSVELLDGFRRVRLEPLRIEPFGQGDASGGRLELRGLADREGTAELRLGSEAWQLLPWLRMAGMTPGESAAALTLDGTLTAKVAEGGPATVEGDLTLVLESRETGETAPQATVALLSPRLRMEGEALEVSLRIRDREEAPNALDLEAKVERPADAKQPVRVTADLRRLDATPWAALWTASSEPDAAPDGAGEEAATRAEQDSPRATGEGRRARDAAPVRPWEIGVAFGSLRYREATAQGGRLDVRAASSWEAALDEVALGDGFISGRAGTSERGGGQEFSWLLDVDAVDLEPLQRSFARGGAVERAGILDIATSGRGEGADLAEALASADGRFVVGLTEGRLGGTTLLEVLVEATGMDEFGRISFGELRGDYPIENGTMFVDELEFDAVAVQIAITGELRADGMDAVANPRVGPDLRWMVPGTLLDGVVGTSGNALALPLIVRVSGPWGDLGTRVEPAAPALLGDLFTGLADVTSSLIGGAEAAESDAEQALDGSEEVVESLLP